MSASDSQTAIQLTADLVREAGFGRAIVVDDRLQDGPEEMNILCQTYPEVAQECELLQDVLGELPKEMWQEPIEARWAELQPAAPGIRDFFATKVDDPSTFAAVLDDLRTVDALEELLGDLPLLKLSLDEWRQQRGSILSQAKKTPTLLFFDQDFSNGGGDATTGINLLKETTNEKHRGTTCGLLTRTVEWDKAFVAWEQTAQEHHIDPATFVLIPKAFLYERPQGFPEMLKLTLLREPCHQLRQRVGKLLTSGTKTAVDELAHALSVQAFEHAVFRTSYMEGVSEVHTLLRLLSLALMRATEDACRENKEVNKLVSRVRHLSTIPTDGMPPFRDDVRALFRRELYEDGERLNELHSPLMLGDVFDVTAKKDAGQFVLVVQPCDVMVRTKDGARTHESDAEFFVCKVLPPADSKKEEARRQKAPGAYYPLPLYDEGAPDAEHCVSFLDRHRVNPLALDLCVFSDEGEASFTLGVACPTVQSAAWQKRHDKVTDLVTTYCRTFGKIASGPDPSEPLASFAHSLSSGGFLKATVRTDPAGVDFNCRRVGRILQPRAGEMLTKFGQYWTRHAFPHDLTREFSA